MKKLLLFLAVILLPFISAAQCNTGNATSCQCKDGTSNCDLLPDITLAKATLSVTGTGGVIEYPQVCNPPCSGNDKRLRVSVSTPNIGFGPLEVNALDTVICGTDTISHPPSGFVCPNGQTMRQLVMQRVYHKNGNVMTSYLRPAGTMTYHPTHGHMHVDDWGIYTLRTATADPNPLNWPIIGTGAKLAFCLMDYGTCSTYNGHCRDSLDNVLTNSSFVNMGLGGGSFNCDPKVQGISSGFTDIYYQHLDGMWINLPSGLCNGNYWIVVHIDPKGYFLESNENNNVLAVPVTLKLQTGVIPKITANGPTTFCEGGSVTLTSTSATDYLWSNGATTQSIVVNQSGVFTVKTNNTQTCSMTSDPIQVVKNPMNISASATPSSICASQNVQLQASAVTSGSYTSTLAFTNSTPVTIPDNNANGVFSVINVSGLSPASLSFNSVVSVKINISHTNDEDLVVTLISPSGNSINLTNRRGSTGNHYTNTVFSASATTAIGSGSPPFTGTFLPEAAFSALTGNLNGDWKLKLVDLSGGDQGSLTNWTLTINRSLPTTVSYAWTSNPAGFTSSNQNPTVTPSVNTTYTVTVNESGTGCSGTKTASVVIGNTLDVQTNTPNAICAGQNTQLTATGATTYTWSPSTGLSATTGSSVTANPTTTTTYQVIGSNGTCVDTAYVTVNVNQLPVVNVNTPLPICSGSSTQLTATGATTYLWTPATGLDATTGSIVNASPASTTTYFVSGSSNGCNSANATPVTVTVNQIPQVTVSSNTSICSGNSANLQANNATTYVWSPSTGLNQTTGANVIASPTVTTTYSVTGTTNNCSKTATVTVTVNEKPAAPSLIQGNTEFCQTMTDAVFSISASALATGYTWTVPPGVTITSGQGTTSVTVSSPNALTGNICVTADNNCGSSAAACLAIHIYASAPAQPPVVSSGKSKVCPGDAVTYSIVAMSDASSYLWAVPANAQILSGQGTTSVLVQFNAGYAGGNITVKGINNCGTGIARYKGAQLNIPATPGAITGPVVAVCQSTQNYSVSQVSGLTYNWTAPAGANVINGQGTNSVSIQFTANFVSGDVSVVAHNNCGDGAARIKSVKAAPKQISTVTGPSNVCLGQAGVAYTTPLIAGTANYNWSMPATAGSIVSGQGTNSITVDFANTVKTFNLKVTATNACGSAAAKNYSVSISNCAKFVDNAGNSSLSLIPNPANDYTDVLYNADHEGTGEIRISNILGQTKFRQMLVIAEGENTFRTDLTRLPSGIYILGIVQDGKSVTQRLIIE